VALRTTYIKNVKFKVIKIRKGCQHVGYFYYSKNLNWAAQNLRLGCGLDIAGLEPVSACGASLITAKCTQHTFAVHYKHLRRGVRSAVKGGTIPWATNHCRGRRKNTRMSQVLSSI